MAIHAIPAGPRAEGRKLSGASRLTAALDRRELLATLESRLVHGPCRTKHHLDRRAGESETPCMGKPVIDVSTLSRSERLELIEKLWESLQREGEPLVTDAQRAELARRLTALERGEMKLIPLDQALTAIRAGRAPS